MRVAVYAIAQNEAAHAARFLAACAEADAIIVADTGSRDGTVATLRAGGAIVHSIAIHPWRFDDARNAALALVPADIDVCFSLDLDEVPAPGWRAALQRGWTARTTLARYRFVTAHLPDGTPAVEMAGARIHARFGHRWRHMCHEILVPDRLSHPHETWLPDLLVEHWPDASKPRSSYLALLEAAVAESPNDPRDLFLLARDYVALGRWAEAEGLLRRYLALAGERWPEQRATGWRRLAKCRAGLSDATGAIACLTEGLRITPHLRDLWLDLAAVQANQKAWAASYAASLHGLAIPIRPGGIPNDYVHAGGRPYYIASVAARHLGRLAEVQSFAQQAHQREPQHALYKEHMLSVKGLACLPAL
jgi:tetratricopeptide (TPR) repeat protein